MAINIDPYGQLGRNQQDLNSYAQYLGAANAAQPEPTMSDADRDAYNTAKQADERAKDAEQKRKFKNYAYGGVSLFAVLVLLVLAFNSYITVPAGRRGVLTTWGKVDPIPYGEGLHFVSPVGQRVEMVNVQTLMGQVDADSASKDLQTVHARISLNFHVTPEKAAVLYQTLGVGYWDSVIVPSLQEAVKAATAKFTAEELITKRPDVRELIRAALSTRLAPHDITVDELSIVNFNFSPSFNQAIEAKVTAAQQKLKAEMDLQRIDVEAQQKISMARAEAETIKIQAEAVKAQGGAEYVQLKAIEKWNGALPQTTAGGALPFINVSK